MILDNEEQRNFLLAAIQNCQIPGAAIDLAFVTRQAVLNAQTVQQQIQAQQKFDAWQDGQSPSGASISNQPEKEAA